MTRRSLGGSVLAYQRGATIQTTGQTYPTKRRIGINISSTTASQQVSGKNSENELKLP